MSEKDNNDEFTPRESMGFDEDDIQSDLPPLSEKSKSSSTITILVSVFIVLVGLAAIALLMVGDDEEENEKKPDFNKAVKNTLPALIVKKKPPQSTLDKDAKYLKPIKMPNYVNRSKSKEKTKNGKKVLTWLEIKKLPGELKPVYGEVEKEKKKSRFKNRSANAAKSTLEKNLIPTYTAAVSASLLPDRNLLITKGTTLDCVLETALNSSLAGLTTCRLTRDVYSDNGKVVLLERGSELTGEYKGGMKNGQVRLFVLWTEAKTPKGVVVALNSPSTDSLGRSGVTGFVDSHFWERFGTAIFLSLLKDGIKGYAINETEGTLNFSESAESGEKVVEKILDATANIPPTLYKNQGGHIKVMVARNLDFSSVYDLVASDD